MTKPFFAISSPLFLLSRSDGSKENSEQISAIFFVSIKARKCSMPELSSKKTRTDMDTLLSVSSSSAFCASQDTASSASDHPVCRRFRHGWDHSLQCGAVFRGSHLGIPRQRRAGRSGSGSDHRRADGIAYPAVEGRKDFTGNIPGVLFCRNRMVCISHK